MALWKTIARNITTYRIQAGLSKKQLAARAKLTPRYVHFLEKGDPEKDPNPTAEMLERLGKALGVSAAQLVSSKGQDDEEAPPKAVRSATVLLRSALDLLEQYEGK